MAAPIAYVIIYKWQWKTAIYSHYARLYMLQEKLWETLTGGKYSPKHLSKDSR